MEAPEHAKEVMESRARFIPYWKKYPLRDMTLGTFKVHCAFNWGMIKGILIDITLN